MFIHLMFTSLLTTILSPHQATLQLLSTSHLPTKTGFKTSRSNIS